MRQSAVSVRRARRVLGVAIIGSDVTYNHDSHDALLQTLATLANGLDGEAGGPPARVLLAAPDWRQPGQQTSNSLRDGFLDRAAELGWRWDVLTTSQQSGSIGSWGSESASSQSSACPVVILEGKAPPPPRRSRVSMHRSDAPLCGDALPELELR